jgi:hypothetical protein
MPAKVDSRNLMAARYLASVFPASYDWQKRRRPVPSRTFGNDSYGDCTLASQANCITRFERSEQRRTVLVPDQSVISNYLEMTGGQDDGWYELEAIKRWRTVGMKASSTRSYQIDGFTQVNPLNIDEVKAAIYQFKMIKVCFDLPVAWAQIEPPGFGYGRPEGIWDVGDSEDFTPGSWGGHSMMSDAYDQNGLWVVHTWYVEPKPVRQLVTWAAVKRYCDEAYSVVDSFDAWRQRKPAFDVNSLASDVQIVTSS